MDAKDILPLAQLAERIVSDAVGLGRVLVVAPDVRRLDRRARNDGDGAVGEETGEGGKGRLAMNARRDEESDKKKRKEENGKTSHNNSLRSWPTLTKVQRRSQRSPSPPVCDKFVGRTESCLRP